MKKIFGLITDSDNFEVIINRNKTLYDKFLLEFDEFIVLNLKNLRLFNKNIPSNNFEIKNDNLSDKYKVYTPKNSGELKDCLKNKELTAFLHIGKDLETFYIHRLLKKIKLIL